LDVTDEIAKKVPGYQGINRKSMGKSGCNREFIASADETITQQSMGPVKDGSLRLRIATFLFAHDKILDASSKLAHHFLPFTAYLNEEDAKRLAIKEGDTVLLTVEEVMLEATASVSDRCQPGGVVVPRISDLQGVNSLVGIDGAPAWVGVRKI
jgi:NADH-quinone oxidoreductase subunit G